MNNHNTHILIKFCKMADDKDEKKEESAESKAEKEAAVGGVITLRREHEI